MPASLRHLLDERNASSLTAGACQRTLIRELKLPEICRFLGISIRMYFNDHNPPHFHVQYESHRAKVAIQELMLMRGELPPRVRALVLEWADLHRNELLANWESLRNTGTFEPIEPLA